jgi:hypothetical protein
LGRCRFKTPPLFLPLKFLLFSTIYWFLNNTNVLNILLIKKKCPTGKQLLVEYVTNMCKP